MLTIFTSPKPFVDPHIRTIQKNALASWKALPGCEVILMADDEGVTETAKEFGVRFIPDIERSEFGLPLLNSAFLRANKEAKSDILIYANADIIFTKDILKLIPLLPQGPFLLVGRRTDMDIRETVDTSNEAWEEKLRAGARTDGTLHSWAGIDYFMFRKGSFTTLPPLVVGRVGWDNWMIHEARRTMPVIDATDVNLVIHQNHPARAQNAGKERKTNPEARQNVSFTKNKAYAFTIEDANWIMTPTGPKKNPRYWVPFAKRYIKYLLGK